SEWTKRKNLKKSLDFFQNRFTNPGVKYFILIKGFILGEKVGHKSHFFILNRIAAIGSLAYYSIFYVQLHIK
ncbi:MAG: hypothetical protein KHY50_09275, partial [Lactobacillus gasseri]|nr:hypothetical protein [Lactobacillus gasseri]